MSPVRTAWNANSARWAEMVEDVRCRYVFKAFDATITSELGERHGLAAREGIAAGSRSYRRAQRLASLVASILPETFERCRRRLLRPTLLPFAHSSLDLLSFGSGVTVFVMRRPPYEKGVKVLKIFRKSLGRPLNALLLQVSARRATYEAVARWYDGCSVVLPTHFLILHGPLLAHPAVACVQPLVTGEKLDLFADDLPEAALVELLCKHPPLRVQFLRFTQQTLAAAETEGACVDLVGRDNLVLVGSGNQLRLLLLDFGVYDFSRKASRAPAALAEIRARLAYLQRVAEQIASVSTSADRG